MHLGHIAIGKSRATAAFGGAVHSPAKVLSQGDSRWWVIGRQRWLDAALFFCFILFVLCAPIATKVPFTPFPTPLLLCLATLLLYTPNLDAPHVALSFL